MKLWEALSWPVDWSATGRGIPTKVPDRGWIFGAGVQVSDQAAQSGVWAAEAVAKIVEEMTEWRTRYDWDPIGRTPVAASKGSA